MCYRHNLAELEGGLRTRWAQKMKSSLDKIESLRTINMYLGLFNKKHTHLQTNSRRIITPVSGFLPGKHHAASIMPYVIGTVLFLSFTFVFLVLKHC
jgi:hypothetical protein